MDKLISYPRDIDKIFTSKNTVTSMLLAIYPHYPHTLLLLLLFKEYILLIIAIMPLFFQWLLLSVISC